MGDEGITLLFDGDLVVRDRNIERACKVVLAEVVCANSVDTFAPRLLKVGGETEIGALTTGFDRTGVEEYPFGIDFDGLVGRRRRSIP